MNTVGRLRHILLFRRACNGRPYMSTKTRFSKNEIFQRRYGESGKITADGEGSQRKVAGSQQKVKGHSEGWGVTAEGGETTAEEPRARDNFPDKTWCWCDGAQTFRASQSQPFSDRWTFTCALPQGGARSCVQSRKQRSSVRWTELLIFSTPQCDETQRWGSTEEILLVQAPCNAWALTVIEDRASASYRRPNY